MKFDSVHMLVSRTQHCERRTQIHCHFSIAGRMCGSFLVGKGESKRRFLQPRDELTVFSWSMNDLAGLPNDGQEEADFPRDASEAPRSSLSHSSSVCDPMR